MRYQRPILLLLCTVPALGLTGCMASIATYNKARGEYTWPSAPKEKLPPLEPKPAYYALLPATIPFDIVTSPFQLPLFIMWVTMPEPEEGIIRME
ncbi:MAG: hypothetical protein EOP87_16015 [Verrucomicrobiaceae bacterium]|nr:MAG: hypothetical protein EOP87_16015 [Verrucomicrobiaceae bacterium]